LCDEFICQHLYLLKQIGMKSLEIKGQELLKKYKTVLGERNNLMDLIAVTTDIPICEGEDGNIDHIKDILLHHLNSHKIKNKDLSDKIHVLEEKLEVQVNSEAPSAVQQIQVGDKKRQEDKVKKLKDKVYVLETEMQEKVTMIAYLEKKIGMMVTEREGDVSSEAQSVSNPTRRTELASNERARTSTTDRRDAQQGDAAERSAGLEATVLEQKRTLALYSNELDKLRQHILATERKNSASSLLKAEQEALLFSLRKDLTAALHVKADNDATIKQLEEYRIRTEGKLGILVENKDKLSQCEAGLDEAHALIRRLQSRLQTAETNLATNKADMALTEEKLAFLGSDVESSHAQLTEAAETSQCLRTQLSAMEERSGVEFKKHSEQMVAKQNELDEVRRSHDASLAASQHAFEASLNEVKKEALRKSQAARLLIDEKIEHIRQVTEHNISLQEEVASGHPADRKIFELASKQATREANLHTFRWCDQ
jgi:hypothetical protein